MKKFRLKKAPFNYTGFFLSIIGFILTLLCLVGCKTSSSKGLYFVKVTNAEKPVNGTSVSIYYGWQAYCIEDHEVKCVSDRSVMIVPFDVSIVNQLNATYPSLFLDVIEQNDSLNPGASPNPPHDPKIFPAAVLCLICSAALLVLCVIRIILPGRYQDEYYSRGFLAWGASMFTLLLLILSSVMYQGAIKQLNLAYPHLIAIQGPGMAMIGFGFAAFTLAGFLLTRGCMSNEFSDTNGYNPL
ncbi:uncharacterized protein BX663DRAFT_485708 [Cokeromyces recurvatus]|uniref:uncharacterized protein n=1 Tax=Cokeromyces recurvatus TaxID=90255 RepID=UPI00221EBF31|nr:uncharacterized protein BX663DRAFT_485708 [Cokeromyces recurvatus]KAI7903579.1 hypothetical protein BX663DRAFT_485708 [Cokeromyces recurvatus]